MSTIRLSGSTSGHYDLTVPAAAGTNSIDLSNLVVDNVAASLTGPLTVSGSQSQTGLKLNSGDTNTATGQAAQIEFGFNGGPNYRHSIATRHDSANIRNNRIDMFVWQTSQNSADLGNRHVASFDGAGVTFPNQPYFYAGGTTNGTVSNGTIPFNDATHNVGSHYNTSNYTFTAPVAGNYLFTCSVLNYPNATGAGEIYFSVNGSGYNPLSRWNGIPSQASLNLSAIKKLSANDTVKVIGNLDYYVTSGHGHFSGMLLG